ncbi:hypothetical protein F4553_003374 [Allocatelliglobosispora scoriae]|uniref:Uncharacterized protein n=1 Tax=Allocatelliglobosispora scoriae TaxID=643052 RepID=A0A841BQM0_9ACTN|nr:hypothetical protein [Allocatelliglobosispora scoriae]MBB5869995.1 hypothetical protein [Allocatelliglobosispora scoriae]
MTDLFNIAELGAAFGAGAIVVGVLQRLALRAAYEINKVKVWRLKRTSWAEAAVPTHLRPGQHRMGWLVELGIRKRRVQIDRRQLELGIEPANLRAELKMVKAAKAKAKQSRSVVGVVELVGVPAGVRDGAPVIETVVETVIEGEVADVVIVSPPADDLPETYDAESDVDDEADGDDEASAAASEGKAPRRRWLELRRAAAASDVDAEVGPAAPTRRARRAARAEAKAAARAAKVAAKAEEVAAKTDAKAKAFAAKAEAKAEKAAAGADAKAVKAAAKTARALPEVPAEAVRPEAVAEASDVAAPVLVPDVPTGPEISAVAERESIAESAAPDGADPAGDSVAQAPPRRPATRSKGAGAAKSTGAARAATSKATPPAKATARSATAKTGSAKPAAPGRSAQSARTPKGADLGKLANVGDQDLLAWINQLGDPAEAVSEADAAPVAEPVAAAAAVAKADGPYDPSERFVGRVFMPVDIAAIYYNDDCQTEALQLIAPERPSWEIGDDDYRPGFEVADELAAKRVAVHQDLAAMRAHAAQLLATVEWPRMGEPPLPVPPGMVPGTDSTTGPSPDDGTGSAARRSDQRRTGTKKPRKVVAR